ncbi:hypothetical protein C0J52_03804 [Blattella germanica]|nr:hypothetical protein C0J52_03804 [Blattella germanica]
MEVSRLEQRAYIKIAVLHGQNARECHTQLLEAVGARALPYRTLATETGIDQATVLTILRHDLYMRKIAAKWVPHTLTEQQKWNRYETCRVNLERYEREGHIMLNRIIAIDETWARAYEPELKRKSAEWRHQGSPRKRKVRQTPSPVKLNYHFSI